MFSLIEKWDTIAFLIYNFYACLRYICFDRFRYRKYLRKNKELKNKHAGQRCFIVLSGPSVANHDLSKITDEVTFCCNNFYRATYYDVVNPDYYCISDSGIAEETFREELTRILEKDSRFIFNKKVLKVLSEEQQKNIHIVYGMHMPNIRKLRGNLSGLSSSFMNASCFAILCAIYMGFSIIYVIGLDHDWKIGSITHCYEDTQSEDDSISICSYHKNKNRSCYFHWGNYLTNLQSFYLDRFADKNNVKIYNVNQNSQIMAYDFIDYESIFTK